MIIEQDAFSDGLDLISPDVQVSTTGFIWLANGRSRYGYVQPVAQPVKDIAAPSGLKQGIISIGNAVIMFVAGNAWYKLHNSKQWIQVPAFSMSPTVPNIYSCAIPVSSRNYNRKLNSSGSVTDAMLLSTNSRPSGTPSGIVCQDGNSQPWIIVFDEVEQIFSARQLNTFANWTPTNGEYVPIGLFMMFMNQKLFIVAPDRQSVYQSISGQPLNFALNVNTAGWPNGNSTIAPYAPLTGVGTEEEYGAASTSFAFDYDPITCLQPVNVTDSFIYATKNNTYAITLNYNLTVFGEPLFTRAASIATGITNQYALIDINGDYAFVGREGIRNFNAVQALKFEGRNSVFSKMVSKLFNGLVQDYAVAFSFNNYSIFNVDTVCGNLCAVYDTISGKWVALDLFDVGKITQTALIDLTSQVVLYAITDTNDVYQLYNTDAAPMQPFLLTRAYSTIGINQYYSGIASYANMSAAAGPITEIKSQKIDLIFRDGTTDGKVWCTEFCNGVEKATVSKTLSKASPVTNYALLPAIQPLVESEGQRITFNFNNTSRGFKLGYAITWNTDAALMKVRLVTTDISKGTSDNQRTAVLSGNQT